MTILYPLLLLGVLIFVHEFGHFIFAKLLGVKVLKFSLGFGPTLVGKQRGETEYVISAVPLGGYVKMLGEEPGEELPEEEKQRAFNFQPVWKRFAIVFAGPVFNLLFACLVFYLLLLTGVPALYPDIGKIAADSPAQKAGLMTGDRVTALDGHPVQSWDDVSGGIEGKDGAPLSLTIRRGDRTIEIRLKPEERTESNLFGEKKKYWEVGISPLVLPVVGEVVKGEPADKAGLKKGDRILAVGGVAVPTWEDMTEIVHKSAGTPLVFRVGRGSEVFERTITPEEQKMMTPQGEKKLGLVGIGPLERHFTKRFGPVESAVLGFKRTWEISALTVEFIVKLIQHIVPAETIGGPILIFQMAGKQAARGAMNYFTFMAVISINLGVLNILPIPLLDGGHLMFLGIECVRRKPLSERVLSMAQRVGLVLLITLMVFALYNDVLRLVTGRMLP
ncbi:MAG: RIP metalloprotease RseP [Nitrospiraceae bacterium]|nr:RIP metalloprotease RseP [Nitrospiraceae bacterium]